MKVLITGTAGFIGFHIAKLLSDEGFEVHGYDGLTDYYDINLKNARQNILLQNSNFSSTVGMLQDIEKLDTLANSFQPDVIIHLAAQAGVRYSLDHPRTYIDSNILGTFNIMEIAKKLKVKHLLIASTSSVYGSNFKTPFNELDKTDTQLTIYAATKKANESMAHSYSHLWKIPTTICRFFTVYGPWGRPDMALFKFVSAILKDEPIDIYNNGEMYRDFTYIDDVVHSIRLLLDNPPDFSITKKKLKKESFQNLVPFRVVNIGNSETIKLTDFIEEIEEALCKKAIYNNMSMQTGDVKFTLADTTILKNLTNYKPQTNYKDGISLFIKWYREYYNV